VKLQHLAGHVGSPSRLQTIYILCVAAQKSPLVEQPSDDRVAGGRLRAPSDDSHLRRQSTEHSATLTIPQGLLVEQLGGAHARRQYGPSTVVEPVGRAKVLQKKRQPDRSQHVDQALPTGIPALVEMPAPHRIVTRRADASARCACSYNLRWCGCPQRSTGIALRSLSRTGERTASSIRV
jgi:hypothetical protein